MDRFLGLRRRVYGDGPTMTRTREHALLGGRVTLNSGEPDHGTPHLPSQCVKITAHSNGSNTRAISFCKSAFRNRASSSWAWSVLCDLRFGRRRSSVREPDYCSPALSLGGRSGNTQRWAAQPDTGP